MRVLKIYNKLTKKNEIISDFSKMTMYVCGPTLYDTMHIGNARSLVVFDVFYRFFKHIFEKVTYVRNITDVEDKIVKKAIEKKKTPKEIVNYYEDIFNKDQYNLNILKPDFQPKVTDFIKNIIEYIENIINNGYAYKTEEGNVYFSVDKLERYDFFQESCKLIKESRIACTEDKTNWKDFALWKKVEDSFGYDSPWGYGRPSWHIECSVMSNYYLGKEFVFHGGGEDLAFPHHHNEIAQNYGAHNCCPAKIFVHNGMVNCNNCKMSKSIGNIIKIEEVVKNSYEGDLLRYMFLATYYSSPININESIWNNSKIILNKLRRFKYEYEHKKDLSKNPLILDYLYEDLNIPATFTKLFQLMKDEENYNEVINTLHFLGLKLEPRSAISREIVENLLENRKKNKIEKNYESVKLIENELRENFIQIQEDSLGNLKWFYL